MTQGTQAANEVAKMAYEAALKNWDDARCNGSLEEFRRAIDALAVASKAYDQKYLIVNGKRK